MHMNSSTAPWWKWPAPWRPNARCEDDMCNGWNLSSTLLPRPGCPRSWERNLASLLTWLGSLAAGWRPPHQWPRECRRCSVQVQWRLASWACGKTGEVCFICQHRVEPGLHLGLIQLCLLMHNICHTFHFNSSLSWFALTIACSLPPFAKSLNLRKNTAPL